MAQCTALPTPGTDEDLDVLDIHLCAASRCVGAGPAGGRPDPAPTPAKDLTRGGSFPLSAVTSARLPQVTFAPGSSKDRGKTPVPTAAGPAPDHPGTTNKVTGLRIADAIPLVSPVEKMFLGIP